MDVREKLVELLYDNVLLCNQKIEGLADDVMDIIANGVTVQEWISVKDRLPEYDQAVLCYKSGRGIRLGKYLDATYADGVQAFIDIERYYAFGVTHWMPLPQPPKG